MNIGTFSNTKDIFTPAKRGFKKPEALIKIKAGEILEP